MEHHSSIRWYNPKLEDFEWREVPTTDEQALDECCVVFRPIGP